MFVVMPRAYIAINRPAGATIPSARAIAVQRTAETTLAATARASAGRSQRGPAPASLWASARGSEYQTTTASRASPPTIRNATLRPRLGGAAGASDAATSDRGAALGIARGDPPAQTGRRPQDVLGAPLRLVVDAGEQ